MSKIAFVVAGLALAAASILSPAEAADTSSSLMKIKVPAALIAKADDPKPPATASQKTSIGKGNARHRPAGSGFYVVSLDATECKAEVAEAYGCKFDAKGNPTACGVAEV